MMNKYFYWKVLNCINLSLFKIMKEKQENQPGQKGLLNPYYAQNIFRKVYKARIMFGAFVARDK